ncbi:MAG: ATP-dependent DNA ligase [Acidobacteriota bacterium]|nr:ATP-dependent DNA ligase [Acidobacteriota bacterium]
MANKINYENTMKPLSSRFLSFAETAERVGATTKRLEKASFLKDYFETLSDEDLILAARFFAGQAFSLADQRTTNIGGAMLFNAISAATGTDVEELRRLTVLSGDVGDTTVKIFQTENPANYTMRRIADFIEQIAETSGTKAKTALLIDFLKPVNNFEAKYIIKILSGDLRIGLLEGAVEDAIARMFDAKVAEVQWTNMLTGDIGETALLFRSGKADTAKMRFFHPIKFMLASASDLDDVAKRMPDAFAVEDKFDGIRGQAHVAFAENDEDLHGVQVGNVRVALFSRTLDEITKSFPELIEPLSKLIENQPGGVILDGEILPIKDDRILPFQDLQKRLGRKTVSEEMLANTPTAFMAYDCLFGDNRILINEPFAARRKVLESLNFDNQFARLTKSKIFTEVAKLDEEFDQARERGNEGLMVKNPSSEYKPGKRGRDWLKIKRALATLDVVVTAVEVGNGRRSRFLSDYTFAVRASDTDSTLLNVGKAYSGLTDAEIEELSEWFKAHTLQEFAHGKVRVVEPQIVLEVTFDRVQPSPRHKGGYALRFPRILRIRNDKPVEEIDTLETVKRLSES